MVTIKEDRKDHTEESIMVFIQYGYYKGKNIAF